MSSSSASPNNNDHRVWFITGTSQGFGQELVRVALGRGDSVVATSRTPADVAAAFPDASDHLLAVSMDIEDPAQIASAVVAAIYRFGRIDVLVNNAGHGMMGAVEEVSEDEVAGVFEINVFGLLRVTREVLPHMRKQNSGHIVNISSIGGLVGTPAFGIYNATKFAVEGISEALAQEAKPLGVGVTVVEPGLFRTDFLGGSLSISQSVIPDYVDTVGQRRVWREETNGRQIGDPGLGAEAIVKAVTSAEPPLHLLLGRDAYQRATAKLETIHAEFEKWRDVTCSTDLRG
jgi:NAD(P)-dependent dehydrogenase (short-subunit alcohol dehydrogenase family)